MKHFLKLIWVGQVPVVSLFLALCAYAWMNVEASARPTIVNQQTAATEALLVEKPLQLVGTAVTGNPEQNLAVIEDPRSRQQWSLREGDRAGRDRIISIRRDYIVIAAPSGEKVVKIRAFLNQVVPVATYEPGLRQGSNPSPAPLNRTGSRKRYLSVDRTEVEAALADSETILDGVDILPARVHNRKTGFRIAAFGKDSIFSRMGLRSGDLLLAINEREIAGPEEAETLFSLLRDGGDIDLTVRRRARTYQINLLIQ